MFSIEDEVVASNGSAYALRNSPMKEIIMWALDSIFFCQLYGVEPNRFESTKIIGFPSNE
jgi:hypothetical protein